MTALTHTSDLARRRATMTVGCLATALTVGLLSAAPPNAGAHPVARSGHISAPTCPVDHHEYARATSAKISGSSVKVKAFVGKKKCGLDGGVYNFGKTEKTLTVHKGAVVKVLKNVVKTTKSTRIHLSKLPHYINRSEVKTDVNIFQVTGPNHAIKKFIQVFIS